MDIVTFRTNDRLTRINGPASSQPLIDTLLSTFGTSHFYYVGKRIFDVLLSLIALIMFLPMIAVIGVLIKLDSKGSVLYSQSRMGARRTRSGRRYLWIIETISVYKFRTMYSGSTDAIHKDYVKEFCTGHVARTSATTLLLKVPDDPRVTRLGKYLRKTSLDEIPQLLNVLLGNMSLVGPRPVPFYEVSHYKPEYFERFTALPGMTGRWQVYGRGRVSFATMMEMDIDYARNPSLLMDIKLLLWTIPAVFAGKGAA